MTSDEAPLHALALKLHAIQAIKFAPTALKNDLQVPLKVDLSGLISFPKVLEELATLLAEKSQKLNIPLLCGVPYTGLALATLIGVWQSLPVITHRIEWKGKAHRAQIDGVFKNGQRCLVIADVLEPEAELFNTLDALEEEGLQARDVLVAIDWQQGGKERLRERGIKLHALMSVSSLVEILGLAKKIDGATHKFITDFFDEQGAAK